MLDTSVFVLQAELGLLLLDDLHIIGPQAGQVAREDKGVAVQTRAVVVHLSAGVVDGVVVIVGVDHPVVVVCERGICWNMRSKQGDFLSQCSWNQCSIFFFLHLMLILKDVSLHRGVSLVSINNRGSTWAIKTRTRHSSQGHRKTKSLA